ncbi:MAG: PIG-L deacetylase family protein [Thermomicrobiales bacterium]
MNSQLRVLAVGAHPDDLEYQIGGTLARYAAQGHHVTMAVVTNGNVGSSTLPPDEIAAIRFQEATASASLIGAELLWLDYDDEFFFYNEESRRHLIDVMRQARPDVVLAHWTDDYHPDHSLSGQAVRDARIMTACRSQHRHRSSAAAGNSKSSFSTTPGRINFQPEVYVDISSTFAIKQQMLAAHVSQNAWISDIFEGSSIGGMMETQSRFRGLQAGYRYAEGFRALETWPRAADFSLLPLEP